ncbi:BMC_2a_G0026310.mRNA.1.CDS.1 [Saccharomyces cerevisiae]|nr:Tir3p [Saccharomyces cerevisiae YJM1447]CAI4399594.1 BMC_2a_G0026310.mRNA.1.CDS.1 [Saccharomyces cerevisiae]CAI4402308.1 BMB_G0026320.mRNA.1.CDS.1 [Saccharomyces cerevisiae]CAI7093314.1 BMC_2a_G0026310.mRNA.1.CDS.1 [Saccharomyces cerevisiae]CAI7094827.1 BMB_G0026320.mRNA.1.CDS.1 [Saccharomyces cerevisiae]
MSFTKIAALLAVAAASTQLVSAEVGQYEIVEFDAILADVKANLEQYMSLAMNNPDFTLPSGVLDVYQHMTTATDDSYTSYFTEMDFAQITTAMVQVPWYSSRLEPEIIAALQSAGISITSLGQSVSESGSESATASSDASSASESSSAASSSASESSSAASSSASEAAKSSSSAKSSGSSAASSASSKASSAASSASSKASSSAASSSAKASSSAEKSTNSSSSATSKNAGAAMDMGFFSAGVGAAIAGAAAMLL